MSLEIVRNDITKMAVDAIVNAANSTLLGGGGVDGCIHRAAGGELLAECRTLGGCRTGEAKITGGYRLPCKYIIHTVGPVWQDGRHGEREQLVSCYKASLALAKAHGCESVAFPLISSGIYAYPKEQALRVAVDTIGDFLKQNEMRVFLVIFDKTAFQISETLFAAVSAFIDDNYVAAHTDQKTRNLDVYYTAYSQIPPPPAAAKEMAEEEVSAEAYTLDSMADIPSNLMERLIQTDESFSQMLLRKIDESGMTDAACYKKANIDRKLFSKIRGNVNYKPSKATVLAFAVALKLTLPDTAELLRKAGFAFSHSSKFDIIVEYFIQKENYNIYEINETLFAFDQTPLGA